MLPSCLLIILWTSAARGSISSPSRFETILRSSVDQDGCPRYRSDLSSLTPIAVSLYFVLHSRIVTVHCKLCSFCRHYNVIHINRSNLKYNSFFKERTYEGCALNPFEVYRLMLLLLYWNICLYCEFYIRSAVEKYCTSKCSRGLQLFRSTLFWNARLRCEFGFISVYQCKSNLFSFILCPF